MNSSQMPYTVQHPLLHSELPALQYSAASFIETIDSSSLSMDPDEFVARMIAAGIADIEVASSQPMSPKVKVAPALASPQAGDSLIPSAAEDNLGMTPQASLASKLLVFAFRITALLSMQRCVGGTPM